MLKKLDWDKKVFGVVPVYGIMCLIIAPIFNTITYTGTRLIYPHAESYHNIYSKLDAMIPFNPWWMLGYVFAFPVWIVGFILIAREERKICYELFIAELLAKAMVLVIFIIYPTIMINPEHVYASQIDSGFIGWLCRLVYGFDAPDHLFPSIHCLENWILFRAASRGKFLGLKYKLFMFIAAMLVFASVLLVKQHCIIDIVGAIAVVEIALFLAKKYNLGRVYFALERKLSGKNPEE